MRAPLGARTVNAVTRAPRGVAQPRMRTTGRGDITASGAGTTGVAPDRRRRHRLGRRRDRPLQPLALETVSLTRSTEPASASTGTYVVPFAPGISWQVSSV